MESLSAWAIANGLGAHTKELNEQELVIQLKVWIVHVLDIDHLFAYHYPWIGLL